MRVMDNYELAEQFNKERHDMEPAAYQAMRAEESQQEAAEWYRVTERFLQLRFTEMRCPHCQKQSFTAILFANSIFLSCRICTRFTKAALDPQQVNKPEIVSMAAAFDKRNHNALEVFVRG